MRMARSAFCRSSPPTLGPTASVRWIDVLARAERLVERRAHRARRGLGVVGVGPVLAIRARTTNSFGVAERLDLRAVDALRVERRPESRPTSIGTLLSTWTSVPPVNSML